MQSSTTPDPGYQWESDKLTVDTTNESQEVSPFPADDHKAHINRRAQRHSKHKKEQKHKRSSYVSHMLCSGHPGGTLSSWVVIIYSTASFCTEIGNAAK